LSRQHTHPSACASTPTSSCVRRYSHVAVAVPSAQCDSEPPSPLEHTLLRPPTHKDAPWRTYQRGTDRDGGSACYPPYAHRKRRRQIDYLLIMSYLPWVTPAAHLVGAGSNLRSVAPPPPPPQPAAEAGVRTCRHAVTPQDKNTAPLKHRVASLHRPLTMTCQETEKLCRLHTRSRGLRIPRASTKEPAMTGGGEGGGGGWGGGDARAGAHTPPPPSGAPPPPPPPPPVQRRRCTTLESTKIATAGYQASPCLTVLLRSSRPLHIDITAPAALQELGCESERECAGLLDRLQGKHNHEENNQPEQ
jgi:hypothetical protein